VEMALRAAKLKVTRTTDIAGTELASCARAAAALAAATAAEGGPDAQQAAAGKVVAEIEAFARRSGSKVGDVAATVSGQPAEAAAAVPLLAALLRDAGVDAPALDGLAGIIEGRVEPAAWTSSVVGRAAA
jgi:glycerol-3-phosphate dehydrogenase (NAD(P)+)